MSLISRAHLITPLRNLLSSRTLTSMASVASTHLALIQEQAGQPLVQTQVPTTSPVPSKIQVRISAAGLNPADQKQWTDNIVGRLPLSFGWDGSGTVTEVGADVDRFKIGDRVAVLSRPWTFPESAAFQELANLETTAVVKIPSSVTFTQAATLPAPWYTAYSGLFHPKALNLLPPTGGSSASGDRSQPVLVWGAGSAVGRAAVQILARAGYTNVLATSGPHRFEDLKALGAQVFDYKDKDVAEQIKKALNGTELKVVFDAITLPASLSEISNLISPGGVLATSGSIGADIIPMGESDSTSIRRAMISVGAISLEPSFGRVAADWLETLLADGKWEFGPIHEFTGGLTGGAFEKGFNMIATGEHHGAKIVVSGVDAQNRPAEK
ncbi:GroES-like protein [Clavulina sp. PMI_390]|nr:GroES-like protein [Clavulina sp. PMI_390]